jgi:hypothetical protein
MELTARITSRVTELTGEVELLRNQLAVALIDIDHFQEGQRHLRPPRG